MTVGSKSKSPLRFTPDIFARVIFAQANRLMLRFAIHELSSFARRTAEAAVPTYSFPHLHPPTRISAWVSANGDNREARRSCHNQPASDKLVANLIPRNSRTLSICCIRIVFLLRGQRRYCRRRRRPWPHSPRIIGRLTSGHCFSGCWPT